MRVDSPYNFLDPWGGMGGVTESSVGGISYPETDAALQAYTGYASAATSLYRFTGGTGAVTDLIGSNNLSLSGTGPTFGGYCAPLESICAAYDEGETGHQEAGDVFDGGGSVGGIMVCTFGAAPTAIRVMAGKGRIPFWELQTASTYIRLSLYDGGNTLCTATSTNFFDGRVVALLYKINNAAKTADLWTNVVNATQADWSGLTSIDNANPFYAAGGGDRSGTSSPDFDISFHAVYAGAAAEGLTEAHLTAFRGAAGI